MKQWAKFAQPAAFFWRFEAPGKLSVIPMNERGFALGHNHRASGAQLGGASKPFDRTESDLQGTLWIEDI